MDSDSGSIFQHYFTTYRRNLSRRSLAAPLRLWRRTKSIRSTLSSGSETILTRHLDEMEPQPTVTNGNGTTTNGDALATPEPTAFFDPEILKGYLKSLLPPMIGAHAEDLESLFDDEFDERVARFAADNGAVVYVVQTKEESEGMSSCFLMECYL